MQGASSAHGLPATGDDDRATNWALMFGGVTTAAIAFVVGMTDGDATTAVLSASLGGIASGTVLRNVMTPSSAEPRKRRRIKHRAMYASTEQLKAARQKLTASRVYHVKMLKDKHDLRRRLVALRDKMEAVALPAYRPRIASIDTALVTIDKQIAIATRLRDGYDKSITMIEIELESGAAADHMNEDISAMIAESVRELRTIEASQAELARQLEANVEVELLLRR